MGLFGTDAEAAAGRVLQIPLSFSVGKNQPLQTSRYKCDAQPASLRKLLPKGVFGVNYINAGDISLAGVVVENNTQVFTNVISASGARYVASHYEWWEEHGEVSFSDVENPKTSLKCKEIQ
ncbi:hypothetical protein D5366_01980 [Neokomagataea tanensis]|uniref:C-type lysozyme inhibitor domain-containing protein n=2 Tax=Neokomagataea TaxID=1223423 RepID=A0A4Y6V6Z0_9PROT|nr:hypothetical protein D5366_01980 [Neokomagataea tanensis]